MKDSKMLEVHIFGKKAYIHPEIGWVLNDQSGAAGSPGDNAYSVGRGGVQPDPMTNVIDELFVAGKISAELASDGWWWRIVKPWSHGLTEAFPQE